MNPKRNWKDTALRYAGFIIGTDESQKELKDTIVEFENIKKQLRWIPKGIESWIRDFDWL